MTLIEICLAFFADTSRPKRPEEVNGRDYYFIPPSAFESDIVSNKFVEHGEFEGHCYGTALDSIRRVANSGKYCILNLNCEVGSERHFLSKSFLLFLFFFVLFFLSIWPLVT